MKNCLGAIDSISFNVLNMSSTSLDGVGVKRKVLSDGLVIYLVFSCGDKIRFYFLWQLLWKTFWRNYFEQKSLLRQLIDFFSVVFMLIIGFIPYHVLGIFCLCSWIMFGSDLPCYLCFFFIYLLNSCYSHSFCLWFLGMLKSSRPDVFRKGILRNFTKFIGKSLSNFIEKEALAQVFSYEFYEISKNTCFRRTPLVPASECFVVISFVS